MPQGSPKHGIRQLIVGRTPWGVPSGPRDAPVPLLGRRIKSFHNSIGRPGGRGALWAGTRASAPRLMPMRVCRKTLRHYPHRVPSGSGSVSACERAGGFLSRARRQAVPLVLLLACAASVLAQSAPPKTVLGTVTDFRVESLEMGVKPDAGRAVWVKFGADTEVVMVAPGELDL